MKHITSKAICRAVVSYGRCRRHGTIAPWLLSGLLLAVAGGAAQAQAPAQKAVVVKGTATTATTVAAAPPSAEPATVGPTLDLVIGKSTLMRLPSPIERISVGNPGVADVSLISPVELYLLGKSYGSTNLLIWRKSGPATAIDVNVNIDFDRMEKKLRELLPEEKGIRVRPAADSVILTGYVSSALKARQAEDIANAFVRDINRQMVLPVTAGDTRVPSGTQVPVTGAGATAMSAAKVVNLLQVTEGQQVMLEVKVAEVSKVLLEKLGVNFGFNTGNGGLNYSILSNLLINSSATSGVFNITTETGNRLSIDANKSDTLVKVLAEPNIVAISGQEASFLAGGKVFIPVASGATLGGGSVVTLQEREFGVGIKFTPTVLDGGRLHLKVAPEVSDIGKATSFTINNVQTILPTFSTNRVQTSVQMMDGQSLAIAGLLKNNVNEVISRVPLLGEIPILGALFRSSEFQNNRSELVFLITPRLVKPLDSMPKLPTDSFVPPSRSEFILGGQLEGSGRAGVVPDTPAQQAPKQETAPSAADKAPAAGGFEVK